MATKARQQYFADETSLQKQSREFSIADDIQQKIDGIEPWAQVNKIETVKVNWTVLVPDANKAVNVEVPEVIDNLYTVDSDNALSAKQWKLLYDYIQNIASRWRFLSNWNSATGLPMTNPSESPYLYKSWDYFVVSNVAASWGTNYRPDGSSYTIWQASTVVEAEDVNVSDFYFYDGTNWLLLVNTARQIAVDSSLSTTSTNPVENRVITNAINWKQNTLTAWNHITISSDVISAEWFQEELTAWENITIGDVYATESDMKWPCPSGFHVPLNTEWQAVYDIWTALGGWSSDWTNFGIALKLPFAGRRKNSSAGVDNQGTYGSYWSSMRNDNNSAYRLYFNSSDIGPQSTLSRTNGYSVRCFKNSPTVPTSSWTKLYWTSIESWWIFWSSTEWLISMSSDWQTWITIADKNLWATTVWNSWDTLSEANCGKYYQRWNNYGFPRTWSVTTSSTQVDASNYWPWNYYSSDTFIKYGWRWDSGDNWNLWWWVTQWTYQECIPNVISATDTTYTAWTWINIDSNNVISATATPWQTYTAWNWININQNNEISADTSVVATQTDLDWKVSKWVNTASGDLFSIEGWGFSTSFWPDFVRSEYGTWANNVWSGLQPGSLGSWSNDKESELSSNTLSLKDRTDMTQTIYAEDKISLVDDAASTTDNYEFSWWWNNQIARLKDVKTYTAWTWINIDSSNNISNTLPWPTIAATAPTGTEWALWYDTTNDVLMAYNWTAWKEAWTQMKILSYGHSTWQNFLDAYNENAVVYCRASSSSDPSTGSQWRLAFMAYVNNANNPTEVEFQYYRSRSDHNSAANQLDEVYVYKLVPASGWTWTVTQRNTAAKAVAWTWIGLTFGSGNMTISADTTVLATQTDLNSKQDTLVSGTNIKTVNSNSLLGSWDVALNDVKISATAPSSPTEWMVWYDTTNDQLKVYDGSNWNVAGKEYNAGEWISIWTIQDYSAMQWPAPDRFHIPSKDEWAAVKNIWTALGGWSSDWTNFWIALKLPFAGRRNYSSSNKEDEGTDGYYWTHKSYDRTKGYHLTISSSSISYNAINLQSYWQSIRAFKDTPVVPTSSWIKLYWTSIEAGWIFWSSTDWLISLSSNWQTWITIQDKNLWATQVWNSWDTLSEANCGYLYQWWNNYWFAQTWTVTTSSTKVDASGYWPWNYYSSSTFITVSAWSWNSVQNDDLRWWVTWVVTLTNAITNTGVLSVNGQTGNVTLPAAEIWLSSETWNVLTAWAKIWTWDETDMPATPNSNTLYFCY